MVKHDKVLCFDFVLSEIKFEILNPAVSPSFSYSQLYISHLESRYLYEFRKSDILLEWGASSGGGNLRTDFDHWNLFQS